MKIKNVRPGILIIADAGLKLAPGDSVEVDTLTQQREGAAAAKALVVTQSPKQTKPQSRPAPKPKDEVQPDAPEADKSEEAKSQTDGSSENAGAQGLLETGGTSALPAAADLKTETSAPVTKPAGAKSGSK